MKHTFSVFLAQLISSTVLYQSLCTYWHLGRRCCRQMLTFVPTPTLPYHPPTTTIHCTISYHPYLPPPYYHPTPYYPLYSTVVAVGVYAPSPSPCSNFPHLHVSIQIHKKWNSCSCVLGVGWWWVVGVGVYASPPSPCSNWPKRNYSVKCSRGWGW